MTEIRTLMLSALLALSITRPAFALITMPQGQFEPGRVTLQQKQQEALIEKVEATREKADKALASLEINNTSIERLNRLVYILTALGDNRNWFEDSVLLSLKQEIVRRGFAVQADPRFLGLDLRKN